MGHELKLEFHREPQNLVSKLGFGTWGLGGDAYGHIAREKSIDLVRYAYQSGIRVFDTSPLYGSGKCEEVLGEALSVYPRDSYKLISKAGLYKVAGVEMRNFQDSFLLESFTQSLTRLQISFIDYFLLHSPTNSELSPGKDTTFGLRELIRANRIKNFGVSMKAPEDFQFIEELHDVGVVELNFSLMDQRLYRSINSGNSKYFTIARTPYNFGFLTDSPPPSSPPVSPNQHLSNWQQSQFDNWHNFRVIWKSIADQNNLSIQDFALIFILSEPKIDLVIPGFMEFDHIDQAIHAAKIGNLTPICMNQIKGVYSREEPKFRMVK
jgi:aryl-alcohol dehydrogenase-like predicted oxidoreductase